MVNTNPASGDTRTEGDDHIRGVKNVLVNTFPNVSGAVTATHTELNYVDVALGSCLASKALTANANANLDASALTWIDLGTVNTADINGGTMDGVALGTTNTANTESQGDNSTKIATTAYADTATGAVLNWSLLDTFNTTGSGTLGTYTSIPATTTMIRLVFDAISIDGTGGVDVEMGDSTWATSSNTVCFLHTVGALSSATDSAGPFGVAHSVDAADALYGIIELNKAGSSNNWIGSGQLGDTAGTDAMWTSTGTIVTPSAVMDRIRVTSPADNFDAGAVYVYAYS